MIISYITLTQVVFTIILLASKRPFRLADKILIVIMADMVFIIVGSIFRNVISGSIFEHISLGPFSILIYPLIYIYVKSSIVESPSFDRSDLKHLIIPAVLVIAGIVYQPFYLNEVEVHNNPKQDIPTIVNNIFSFSYVIYYMVLIYRQVRAHKKKLPDHFSYSSSKITLNWINLVVYLFTFNGLSTGFVIGMNLYYESQIIDPGVVYFFNLAIFAFFISYFGFHQRSIFQKDNYLGKPELTGKLEKGESKTRYQKSTLTENQAQVYVEKVKDLIESKQLYLDSELTIHTISERLQIPRYHLTESLNTYLGKNFYTLINEYRVDAFMKMVNEKDFRQWTFLAVAFESGFNSKSSFNLIFKKHTGQTPSQYFKSIA